MHVRAPKCPHVCPNERPGVKMPADVRKRAPGRQNARPRAQIHAQAPKCPPACPKRAPGAKMPARVPKCAPSLINYLKIKFQKNVSRKKERKKEDESSLISRPKRLRRLKIGILLEIFAIIFLCHFVSFE